MTTKKTTTRKTKIAAVCSNVELTPGELQRLVGERDKFRKQRVRDFKCLQELRGNAEALTQRDLALRQRVKELEDQLGEGPGLRERVATLERSLQEANQRAKVLADRASEAAIQRVAALEAAEALRAKMDAMAARAVEKVKAADEAHCAVGEMQRRVEQAEMQMVDSAQQLRERGVLVASMQEGILIVQRQLADKTAALEESERTVATLAADGRALRAQKAELEDQLRAHVARWEDQGAALCVSRLETSRMRGELGQLAVAVRTQVERFLLHAGALPAAAAIIPLVELLSEAAVRHQQAILSGGLQESEAKVQDQVQQEAAEGGQNGGGE